MYYFASDIHLGAGDTATARSTEQRFVRWLTEIESDAEALFLLGDIFDFWFEYGKVVPKGFVRTLGQLTRMTDRGIRVVMLTGNHDMWVRNYLHEECGIEVYTRPQLFEVAGRRLMLAHGDNLGIKGAPMLRLMNAIFRSRVLRFLASWLIHPDLFVSFGRWWSGSSRKVHGQEHDLRFLEPLVEYARKHQGEAECFIFGHMHITHEVRKPQHLLFMGDWHYAPNCLVMNDEGEITQKILE